MTPYRWMSVLMVATATLTWSGTASAQAPVRQTRTARVQLQAKADSISAVIGANRLRSKDRLVAESELVALQARLRDGDFQVGDRFIATIVTDVVRSDSVLVREDFAISLATLPDANVRGVLHAELVDYLNAHVARFLKNATVRAEILTRVTVTGTVLKPGYYYLAPNRPLSEAITASGGPVTTSNQDGIQVWRAGREFIGKKVIGKALREGLTLEQLQIRSGDEIRVPEKRKLNWGFVTQLLFAVSTVFFGILQFLIWYYRDDR